jgi:hypothetical protein
LGDQKAHHQGQQDAKMASERRVSGPGAQESKGEHGWGHGRATGEG